MMKMGRLLANLSILSAFLLAFLSIPLATHAQPYTEFSAGIVDIEAEAYTAKIGPRSDHDWTETAALVGFSGAGSMQAMPNTTANIDANWTTLSPELQYSVTFLSGGTRYVWLRGQGATDMDDSAHASLNGGSGTSAARITLSEYNAWQWTRTQLTTGNPATISVPGAGAHTLNLWMREDGFAVDRILLTSNDAFSPTPGNAWHIPDNAEPAIASMRNPFREITPDADVTIYSGNQFQGDGGNPGNQFQTGSAVFWRKRGEMVWMELPMTFHSESGNNKYYSATFAGGTFAAGDTIEYYIRAIYDDHLPTYLYGDDRDSNVTDILTVAQANPFSFTVQAPLAPAGGYVSITNGDFEGRIYTANGHVELAGPDLQGNPLALTVALAPPGAYAAGRSVYAGTLLSSSPIKDGLELKQNFGGTTVTARLIFASDGVLRYEVTDWGGLTPAEASLRAASPDNEHFYGFGEKFNTFDQAGKKVRMLNVDVPGHKGDSSYKVSPWFLSTRGYGLLFDSSADGEFDMRSTFANRYTANLLDGVLAFEIVGGPRLTTALERHTARTGRPSVPPEWVFGPWISTDIWRTGGEVRYAISRMVALDIPVSVIVFDSPWEVAYNDFTWNMNQFDNGGTYDGQFYPGFATVTDMMNFLRNNGVKVVCWMTPFINVTSNNEGIEGANLGQAANYADGAVNNYFVRSSPGGPPLLATWWKGTGSPVDFTNPAATAWLQNQLQTLINGSRVTNTKGDFYVIGGFKTDDGEALGGANVYIPASAVYHDGRTGVQMQNAYSLEYHRAVWEVLGDDGVVFARSGFTGSQAFPAYWSGDNEPNFGAENGLPSVIVAAQSSAMSGFSMWSCDVGGYIDGNYSINPDDLFMRWAQFGALTPIMQMHRQVGSEKQYPWRYSGAALSNYRECAKLHSRLFPFIYTYAHQAAATGLPIMRPLVLMHQEDSNTWGINHTYLFGDEMLVAPFVMPNQTSRTLYLPAGTWYDYWTNEEFTGAQLVNWSNADTSKFPLFVKSGSVVPMLASAPQSLCPANYVDNPAISTRTNDLDILVYPAAQFGFAMFDGTDISGSIAGDDIIITLTGEARAAQLRVHGSEPPFVSRNETPLQRAASKAEFDGLAAGWWYDAAMDVTLVKFAHPGGKSLITLGPGAEVKGYTSFLLR